LNKVDSFFEIDGYVHSVTTDFLMNSK